MSGTNEERIVVGVDGSPEAEAALRWANAAAQRAGAMLDVVTAWSLPAAFSWDVGAYGIDWQGDAEKSLQATLDEVFGADRPANLRTFALEGDPAHCLVEHARGARMLVVGNRGRGGFRGLLLGSVSSKCAAHAKCPVLIVHAGDELPAE
ncbi:universal stress protein [Sporichthya brevicatena]|uniref:Universal stress protein n=1 Tax=Sporichthya brevicatena TaxID=171442 RepID=A0ABP3SAK0_9ACTN